MKTKQLKEWILFLTLNLEMYREYNNNIKKSRNMKKNGYFL